MSDHIPRPPDYHPSQMYTLELKYDIEREAYVIRKRHWLSAYEEIITTLVAIRDDRRSPEDDAIFETLVSWSITTMESWPNVKRYMMPIIFRLPETPAVMAEIKKLRRLPRDTDGYDLYHIRDGAVTFLHAAYLNRHCFDRVRFLDTDIDIQDGDRLEFRSAHGELLYEVSTDTPRVKLTRDYLDVIYDEERYAEYLSSLPSPV